MLGQQHMRVIVGWHNKDEWDLVHSELFSNDVLKQKRALDRIAVWKARMFQDIPWSIDCTAQLMTAFINDRESLSQMRSHSSEEKIRMVYSMAVVRFVNELTDNCRYTNTRGKLSVLEAAEKSGLPSWVVEIRHESTHAMLPSLSILRSATKFALAWIKREYWDCQSIHVTAHLEGENSEEIISDWLITYMQERFKQMKHGQSHNVKNHRKLYQTLRTIKIFDTTGHHGEQSADILASEGYLLTTVEQLESLQIDVKDLLLSRDLRLPDNLVRLWWPCLLEYHYMSYINLVIKSLAKQLTAEKSLLNRLRAGWIITLVQAFEKDATGEFVLYPSKLDLDKLELLHLCTANPGPYTDRILKCLINIMQSKSLEQANSLLKLVQCYLGKTRNVDGENAELEQVYTVDTLMQKNEANSTDSMTDKKEVNSGAWKRGTDWTLWKNSFLGTCPGVDLSVHSLELDIDVDNWWDNSFSQNTLEFSTAAVEDVMQNAESSEQAEAMEIIEQETTEDIEKMKNQIAMFVT